MSFMRPALAVVLAMISVASESARAEVFVEASTGLQKIGVSVGDFRPFVAGSISHWTSSRDSRTPFMLGFGTDWLQSIDEIEYGVRIYGTASNDGAEIGGDMWSGSIQLLAQKSFGALAFGAGIGPGFSRISKYSDETNVYTLSDEIFAQYHF